MGGGGPGAYSTCVQLGIGARVLLNMLPGETESSIQQALASLPLTARRSGIGRFLSRPPKNAAWADWRDEFCHEKFFMAGGM